MKDISPRGIIFGAAVDVGMSIISGMLVSLLYFNGDFDALTKMTGKELETLVGGTPFYNALAYTGAALASILGGYVAAVLAKRGHALNGALSSFLFVLMNLSSVFSGEMTNPVTTIGAILLAPVLGALGGLIRRQQDV